MMEHYNLPNGEVTSNSKLYISMWRAIADRLLELLFVKGEKCWRIGYDPGFLLGDAKKSIDIPTWVAINLIKNVDGKLPWE